MRSLYQSSADRVYPAPTQWVAGRVRWDDDAVRNRRHLVRVNTRSRARVDVLAERDAASAAELTPNMAILGDPLPGRSALDEKMRASQSAGPDAGWL